MPGACVCASPREKRPVRAPQRRNAAPRRAALLEDGATLGGVLAEWGMEGVRRVAMDFFLPIPPPSQLPRLNLLASRREGERRMC